MKNLDNDNQGELKNRVLERIQSGRVSMRPKIFFTFKLAAIGLVSAAVVLVTIFVISFVFFSIRITSQTALLGFGLRGLWLFIRFFPWGLLLVDLLLIILLESLLRRFRFGYRTPVLYSILAILALSLSLGLFLDRGARVNDRLFIASRHLPPPIGRFYEGAEHLPPRGSGICRCTITAINGNKLSVIDTRFGTTTLTVILPPNDDQATSSGLKVGDRIFIAGDEDDGVIRAFGVHKTLMRMEKPESIFPF